MIDPSVGFHIDNARISELLNTLERMAAGDRDASLPLSPEHDELDAVAFGINVLADEIRWAHGQITEAVRRRAEDLRRSKEAAERANESKGVFLRNASHELRTPVSVVLTIAELLARPDLSSEERTNLTRMLRDNSRAVLSLVGRILDLSRLEGRQPATRVEAVSPLELVREIVQSFEPEARLKGLTVAVDVKGTLPDPIAIDRLGLRQILVNIVANALKFTETGGIRIGMELVESTDPDRLHIDVFDTGIGIPPERHRHLFEPFGEGDSLRSRVQGGTGLGLAISRRLAEQLEGELMLLQSTVGRGSTFRLILPVRRVEAARFPSAEVIAAATADSLAGVRVLLADDSTDLQLAVQRLLGSMGASVDCAGDGREALTMATARRYDIVLMDVVMPRLSGIDATRALRSSGCDVPIIGLTADATSECRKASLEAGCSMVLLKPFDPNQLVASIGLLLRRDAS